MAWRQCCRGGRPGQLAAVRPDSWEASYIHQVAGLQRLSNTDKHQVIHPYGCPPGGGINEPAC